MENKKQFRPQHLRTILSVLFVIIILAGSASYYFGLDIVGKYALDLNQRIEDSEASGAQIQRLQALKNTLAQKAPDIATAESFFTTSAAYQSQLSNNVSNEADKAGLSIASTTFGDGSTAQTQTITITFKQVDSFRQLIDFLDGIETNIPKLQVNSINLGSVAGGSSDSVAVGEINIGIAVR